MNTFTEQTGLILLNSKTDYIDFTCDILRIPNEDRNDVEIVSEYKEDGIHLVLVHYKEDCTNHNVYKHRGTCVDLLHKNVIATSYGKSPCVVDHELTVDEDGCLLFQDDQQKEYSFCVNGNETEIYPAFEGVFLRFIWHNRKMISMTHRKLNPVHSRWGNSKKFLDVFFEVTGIKQEQLFDCELDYSSTCHEFLLVMPELLVGSKQIVKSPYALYLGSHETPLFMFDSCTFGHCQFESIEMDTPQKIMDKPGIYKVKPMDVYTAEKFLNKGFNPEFFNANNDPSVIPNIGESLLIVSRNNQDGKVSQSIKVNSSAFQWRCDIRENNPNLKHQFYAFLGELYNISNPQKFIQAMYERDLFHFEPSNLLELESLYTSMGMPISVSFKETMSPNYSTLDSRIHVLFLNFFISLPYHLQLQAFDIYKTFYATRNDLLNFLSRVAYEKMYKPMLLKECKSLTPRMLAIILNAMEHTQKQMAQRPGVIFTKTTEDNIKFLIQKENGRSLYKMTTHMKKETK